jgi:hypothetical protein
MAQARPKPLLDAHTMARRPLIPRSTVSLPLCQVMFVSSDAATLAKSRAADKALRPADIAYCDPGKRLSPLREM